MRQKMNNFAVVLCKIFLFFWKFQFFRSVGNVIQQIKKSRHEENKWKESALQFFAHPFKIDKFNLDVNLLVEVFSSCSI